MPRVPDVNCKERAGLGISRTPAPITYYLLKLQVFTAPLLVDGNLHVYATC